MRPIPDRLLPHTVTVEAWVSDDAYGTPAYSAAVEYPARVEHRTRTALNAAGQLVRQAGRVFIGGSSIPTIGPRDRLTLPDGKTPPILSADRLDGPDGTPHHAEVSFG